MPVSISGTNGVTFPDSSLQTAAASPYVLKNRIINGDMRIDQRNAGASVNNGTGNVYTLDRWASYGATSSKFSIQQDAGSVTPPVGFNDYLGTTSSSAYAVPAGESYQISQLIEGYNIADLAWGTANAKTVTLSFWVRSSLTGTFGGALQNGSFNYSYPFSYTILSANTWEFKTITIAGPTAGTWNVTTGIGIVVNFGLGIGSTYSGTAGAWAATNYGSATGATSVVGTNGATFYITGVQLEQNTSATPFERRLYNQELANCQRYYEKSYDIGTVPASASTGGLVYSAGSNGGLTTSFLSDGKGFIVSKRAAPTMTIYDQSGNSGKCNREYFGVSSTANSTVVATLEGNNNFIVYSSGSVNSMSISYHYVASAEL
jgi:hypothetical protein